MVMDIARVHEQLREPVKGVASPPLDNPLVRLLARTLMPLAPLKKQDGVALERRSLDKAKVVIYRPERQDSDAVLLWIHGGGYLIGGPVQDHGFCADTARQMGMTVISVQYRLWPEPVFSQAHDDCLEAWDWVQDHGAELGVDTARVVIGGQSAGGGLAAGLIQHLKDRRQAQPLAQWLFCPMLDDRTAARSDIDATAHYTWSNRLNAAGWKAYLGQEPGRAMVPPYAVPARREDLSGLPPAWIGVGDIDLFHDENRAYAERLTRDGVKTELVVVPGAPHGFESWASTSEVALAHLAQARDWLGRAVSPGKVS